MKKSVLFIIGILIVGGIGWYIFSQNTPSKQTTPTPLLPTTPSETESFNESSSPDPSSNITVETPKSEETVSELFEVRGRARVFENRVSLRVKDAKGVVLLTLHTDAESPDVGQFGPYLFTVNLASANLSSDTPLTIEVFQASAKDGSDADKVTLPLTFNR